MHQAEQIIEQLPAVSATAQAHPEQAAAEMVQTKSIIPEDIIYGSLGHAPRDHSHHEDWLSLAQQKAGQPVPQHLLEAANGNVKPVEINPGLKVSNTSR